jgi:hypothetical protein
MLLGCFSGQNIRPAQQLGSQQSNIDVNNNPKIRNHKQSSLLMAVTKQMITFCRVDTHRELSLTFEQFV